MSATTAGLSPERLAILDRVITEKYISTGLLPASTYFLADPTERFAIVAMAQVHLPPYFDALERHIYTLIYSAFTESYA